MAPPPGRGSSGDRGCGSFITSVCSEARPMLDHSWCQRMPGMGARGADGSQGQRFWRTLRHRQNMVDEPVDRSTRGSLVLLCLPEGNHGARTKAALPLSPSASLCLGLLSFSFVISLFLSEAFQGRVWSRRSGRVKIPWGLYWVGRCVPKACRCYITWKSGFCGGNLFGMKSYWIRAGGLPSSDWNPSKEKEM